MGFVLWLYRAYLTSPTMRRWTRSRRFRALTPSQIKTGKYFIVVALVFLASSVAGAIMAHSYYERELLRHPAQLYPAVQFPAQLPYPGADHLDRRSGGLARSVSRSGDCRRSRGARARIPSRSAILGSLFVVAGALLGDYLGIRA